jgi:hypothetical protein
MIWNGPGPFQIINNYLEGAAQCLIFGGADPTIAGLVPADITITHNQMEKPLSWKPNDPSYAGVHWMVKNLLELKNARRVTVDGNLFEHCWADAQSGEVALFTVRNQDGGAPWATVEDVTFTNNLGHGVGGGISVLGHDDNHPSQLTKNIVIRNNLLFDVGGAEWGGWGRFLTINSGTTEPGPVGVTLDHNTVLPSSDAIVSASPGTVVNHPGFVFTHNVVAHNGRGVWGDGTAPGDPTLSAYFADAVFTGNVFIGGPAAAYAGHPGNQFPATLADVGFVDATHSDYRLAAASRYHDVGIDAGPLDASAACRLVAAP